MVDTSYIEYACDVLNGRIPACKWVKLACERFNADLERPDLSFSDEEAGKRIEFFRTALTLENGQPFELPAWQQFIVANVYGWFGLDGRRRFNQVLILVPRKNAKSTLVSGMGISSFFMDDHEYSQFYCLASDRGQASLLKDYGEGFVKRSVFLQEFIDIRTHEMRNRFTHGKWKALHADWRRLDGLNPYWVVFDEFHAQETPNLDDVIDSAFGSQAEYLYMKITTAGEYKRDKPCVKQQHYGEQILEKIIERDNFFYINYTVDEGDDWQDPKTWIKANPNLGISKNMKNMEELCEVAKQIPSKLNDFLTKQLNIWCESDVVWIPAEEWNANGGQIREAELYGLHCYGGLDLARVSDLSALALLFPPQQHLKKWTILCRFWAPEKNIAKRSHRDRVPYDLWKNSGHIRATGGHDGKTTDFNFIRADIEEDARKFKIEQIGFDPFYAAELVHNLTEDGIEMVPFRQGFISMGAPVAEIERMILGRMFNHGNNPVLAWNASNCVIRKDPAGNMKIDKERSNERVDGMVALAMAVGISMLGAPKESVYENRDIRTL